MDIQDIADKDSSRPSLSNAINEDSNHLTRHRTQLSCDTRAAIKGGIEPYQPPQKKEEEDEDDEEEEEEEDEDAVVVVDYPSHVAQSAMV